MDFLNIYGTCSCVLSLTLEEILSQIVVKICDEITQKTLEVHIPEAKIYICCIFLTKFIPPTSPTKNESHVSM